MDDAGRIAGAFLALRNPEDRGDNLGRVDDLAVRMGRIIRNLSAFARAEPQPADPTDLAQVIGAALEITETRCREAGVQIRLDQPAYPVIAMGGEMRLGQVVANLIAKAVDAVAGRDDARLTVTLRSDPPRITVRDTGSGLANPAEIFDPVYTTKEVGAELGLGLPIDCGIVSGFGRTIRGRNTGEGAEFTVELVPAPQGVAA
ncbi:sensor histidine kinase [Jannaschia rubra]|uniref:sensor histidine kinase n=1 Tax=Jannaschia rubra TaxID=282197 RepID=UPI0024915776|nr:ATP-binding protein [Jannaschia rubra]